VTGEFSAIADLRRLLAGPCAEGEIWIGDDAAVLQPYPGAWTLLAADTLVAGVHADLALTGLDDMGWKAMVASLSDIAAMGGHAGHALVTVATPPGTDLEMLYSGLAEASREYRCPIVGGDLTSSTELVVTVAVTGWCSGRPVLRNGASPGDSIWMAGRLGASAAGLRLLRGGGGTESDLARAHARPRPLLDAGRAARSAGASAMIDVSDGLLADLSHICEESAVGFRLTQVPAAEGATSQEALRGGEDFALVFCVADRAALADAFDGLPPPVELGECSSDPSERLVDGVTVDTAGWEHHW
jgi:thiamine-monophosphate kinase